MPHFAPPGPLGFGGAPLGNMFDVVDEPTAAAALAAAWDSGVRYYDTAPHYGSGLSEHRFGAALRHYPREQLVLSTKVGRLLRPDSSCPENPPFKEGLPFRVESTTPTTPRCARWRIAASASASPPSTSPSSTTSPPTTSAPPGRSSSRSPALASFRALTDLRSQGVIKGWGLGVNLTEPCIRALEQADPDVFLLAGRYSLLNQPALDRLFPFCAERGVHVVVGGPYNSGLLAGGRTFEYADAPPEMVEKRDRIAAICARHGTDIRSCRAHSSAPPIRSSPRSSRAPNGRTRLRRTPG